MTAAAVSAHLYIPLRWRDAGSGVISAPAAAQADGLQSEMQEQQQTLGRPVK